MSQRKIEKISCPTCGNIQKQIYYPSVNVTLDPEMKNEILSRETFKFACEKCGHQAVVLYPFLYHDMDHKLMIYVDVKRVEGQDSWQEHSNVYGSMLKKYTHRRVNSLNQLLEKIRIFDAKLNDGVIEIAKFHFKIEFENGNPGLKIEEIFFGGLVNDQFKIIIFFQDGRNGEALLDLKMLTEIERNFGSSIQGITDGEMHMIDANWALEVYQG